MNIRTHFLFPIRLAALMKISPIPEMMSLVLVGLTRFARAGLTCNNGGVVVPAPKRLWTKHAYGWDVLISPPINLAQALNIDLVKPRPA